jgi:hypothetical protein
MPTPRTTPRSAGAAGRFGRTQPPAGRLGRTTGRTTTQRPATRRATTSARIAARRKPPQRSAASKALNGVAGLIPGSALGRAAKPSAGTGKGRKAGFALIAGAAGLALKNRDKLPFGRKTEEPYETAPEATPVATTPDPLARAATPVAPATPAAPATPPVDGI